MNEQRFIELAGQMMRSALDSWRAGNRDFSVLHAGMGCEYALKALLAHHNPLYLSDKGDRALRFHALGFGDEPGVKPLTQARTIGLSDAFKDATILMQGRMPVTEPQFQPLMESRNGIVHLAYHDDEVTEQALTIGTAIAEAVRSELGLSPAKFWGDYHTIFNDLGQVGAMTAPVAPLQDLEAEAETLAQQEAEHARLAANTAAIVARQTARYGSAHRIEDEQKTLATACARAAMWTALQAIGMRAQRNVISLLESHDPLPLDDRPRARQDTGSEWAARRWAHNVVNVKTLVAARIFKAFIDTCKEKDAFQEALADVLTKPGVTVSHPNNLDLLYWMPCQACGTLADIYGDVESQECLCDPSYDGQVCAHPDGVMLIDSARLYHCPACSLTLANDDELEAVVIELNREREE